MSLIKLTLKLGKIRKFLDRSTTEQIVNAAITSRLDYCNSLLYGLPKNLSNQLQLCQNNAARIITRMRKFDHITPVLVDLHWLRVEYRITYKILLITFKAQQGLAPQYISDLISSRSPGRSGLRSRGKNLLMECSSRLKTFGARSYAAAAPHLWNKLPDELRDQDLSLSMFKSKLKTHLFTKDYFV